MPLVLDPAKLPEPVLRELLESLRTDLRETEELVLSPPGRVRNPSSLEAAAELVRATAAMLDAPDDGRPVSLAGKANLAYAVLVVAIDLVKSHTDVPRVPRARPKSA